MGVLIGLTNQAEVPQDKQLGVQSSCMKVSALGTIIGSALGTSPHIVAVESAAGIAEGGRTGLNCFLTIAGLFIASLFLGTVTHGYSYGGYSASTHRGRSIYDGIR